MAILAVILAILAVILAILAVILAILAVFALASQRPAQEFFQDSGGEQGILRKTTSNLSWQKR